MPTAGADSKADTSPDSIITPSHLDSSSANPSILQTKLPQEGTSLVSVAPALIRAKRKWRALVDSDTGGTYYVDEATGVSQWEQPSPEEVTLSTETVRDSPTEAMLTSSPYQQAHQAETSLVGVVPALLRAKQKWRNLVDTNTGSTYYVNEATGTTQWEKPPEIDGCQPLDDGDTVQDPQMKTPAVVGVEATTSAQGENENENRNALASGGSTDERNDALETPRVFEVNDLSKLPGKGAEVPASGQTHKKSGGVNTSGLNSDPVLQRVDSNSTLSTYGGELDSLAKYVTGHSSTLDRGAVVSIEVPSEEREAASPADMDEEASDSTDRGSSGGSNHSGSGSDSKNSEENTSKHSTSSRNAFINEKSMETPSSGVDAGVPFKEEPCSGEEQQDTTTETTANSSFSGSVQSVRQSLASVVSADSLGHPTAPLPSASDVDAKEQGTSIGQQRSPPQEEHPGSEAESTSRLAEDGKEGDTGNVSTAQDFDESDDLRRRSSPPGEPVSSSGSEGTAGELDKERPAGNSRHDLEPITVASEPSSDSSTNNASPDEEVLDGDDKSIHIVPSGPRQPSRPSFDDVAVATLALQRLQAGMLRRRQSIAIVKLQVQARGWAARRLYSRLVERRDTRRREEREAKQRAATAIQAVARGRVGRREALLWQTQRDRQHSRNMLEGSDNKSDDNEKKRTTTFDGMDDFDDVSNIQGTAVLLQSEQECNVEDKVLSPHSVPEETTVEPPTGRGQGEDEQYDGGVDGAVSANGWDDRADLIDINDNRTSEEGPSPRGDGHTYALSEHEHSIELDRDEPPVGIDAYGMGTAYESAPLGTIDEVGYQRNEYLWGGGGATPEEPNAEVLSSSGDEPPGDNYDTAVSSPKGSGRQQDADTSGDERSASDNADYGFDDEESTREVTDTEDNDSDERIYNSSRTTMSSERTSGEGIPSDLTVSEGDEDRSGSSSEDGYLRQHSVRSEEEEAQQQQQQQPPPETTIGDGEATGVSAGVDREMSTQSEDNISRTNAGELDHEGEDMESLQHAAEEEKAREGVYLDTSAPLESLEELRTLVVAQAQAAARATMTAAGTDASKREAIRIRYGMHARAQAPSKRAHSRV